MNQNKYDHLNNVLNEAHNHDNILHVLVAHNILHVLVDMPSLEHLTGILRNQDIILLTKPTILALHPLKAQINLGIHRPVWSQHWLQERAQTDKLVTQILLGNKSSQCNQYLSFISNRVHKMSRVMRKKLLFAFAKTKAELH